MLASMDNAYSGLEALAIAAKNAAKKAAASSLFQRNAALQTAANFLRQRKHEILLANADDCKGNLPSTFLDRLLLNESRIEGMAKGLEDIERLPDPLHRILEQRRRPNGLLIEKISVPIGVIGIIYESRPNVTADAGGLCIKSGNAAILRGGSESQRSSAVILECLQSGLDQAGLPATLIQALPNYERETVGDMLRLHQYIDLIVPRGGKNLIDRVMQESRIPVLAHLEGNNHTYIHHSANPDIARRVVLNAKMRRPGVCGATEKLIVDRAFLPHLTPLLVDLKNAGCILRGDTEAQALDSDIKPASAMDWDKEYLDSILALKVVKDIDEALSHIEKHGSHHTEAIIASDSGALQYFTDRVDAAILMTNTSTQFADGAEFGLGAEIGIATGRLHARGPVGAQELTIYKYIVRGDGQIRL